MENEADRGHITISIDGDHELFGKVITDADKRQRYGIFIGSKQTAIPLKDTSPTW